MNYLFKILNKKDKMRKIYTNQTSTKSDLAYKTGKVKYKILNRSLS